MPEAYDRQPVAIPRDKRRARDLDWQDTRLPGWVAVLSAVCTGILLVTIIGLSQSDRVSRPPLPMGDQLGPIGMPVQDYDSFARRQLAEATGSAPRWALVTPTRPWTLPQLDRALADTPARVSTLYIGPSNQQVLPEPSRGITRAQLFASAFAQAAAGAGVPKGSPDIRVTGVLVWAAPDVLRGIARAPGVQTVEPTDPAAVYGRIGIRPLVDPEEAQAAGP